MARDSKYTVASVAHLPLSDSARVLAVEDMENANANRHKSTRLAPPFTTTKREGFNVVMGFNLLAVVTLLNALSWLFAGEGSSHFVWSFLLVLLAVFFLEPQVSMPDTASIYEKRIVLRKGRGKGKEHNEKHLLDMRFVTDVRIVKGLDLWVRSIFGFAVLTHSYVTDNSKAVLIQCDLGQWQWSYIISVDEPELFVLAGKEAIVVERHEEFLRKKVEYPDAFAKLSHGSVTHADGGDDDDEKPADDYAEAGGSTGSIAGGEDFEPVDDVAPAAAVSASEAAMAKV